jgi:ABC-type dipeptide/oligopeptide/nickel transport system ATPase component
MSATLLEVKNLKTCFHTDDGLVRAVDGVDIRIREGETLAMVGESGCGKSVTALSILRLVASPGRIEAGEILFKGEDLLAKKPEELRRIRGNEISMIFQEPMSSLNPVYTIGDQIVEAIRLHQHPDRRQAWKQAADMLRLVGIPAPEQRLREYPCQLSGGMRQRAMIAMALSCRPSLIIADEPTTALDVTIQAQILELIKRLKGELGAAVLMITHDLGVVAEMADSVAVLYAGKVVEYGTVAAIFSDPLKRDLWVL